MPNQPNTPNQPNRTPFPLSQQGAGRKYSGETGTFQNRPIAYYNNQPSGGLHIAPTDNISGWSPLEHAWEAAGRPRGAVPGVGGHVGGGGGNGVNPPGSPPGPSPGLPPLPPGPVVPPPYRGPNEFAFNQAPGIAQNVMQAAPWVPPGWRPSDMLPAQWTGPWSPSNVDNAAKQQLASFNNPGMSMIGGR